MYTGSMIVDAAGSVAGRRARPFSSIVRLVSSSVSILPASYQPSTSIDFDLRALVDHVLERVGEIVLALVLRLLEHVQSMPSYSSFQFLM